MSQYSHSHPFPPRSTAIADYITTKKPKTRKPKAQRSRSSSPRTQFATPPTPYIEPTYSAPQAHVSGIPQINAFVSTPAQVESPVIVQGSSQDSASQRPLYLIHPDAKEPIELPPWVAEFRPRIPPLNANSSTWWESPIPWCDSITHAILIREALTKFHFAVYLADEDAGESEDRFRQNLAQICCQYMPAMKTLGIKKHQIVFFYHGRRQIRMGNLVWDAMTDWEYDSQREAHAARTRSEARGYEILVGNGWSYIATSAGTASRGGQDVRW